MFISFVCCSCARFGMPLCFGTVLKQFIWITLAGPVHDVTAIWTHTKKPTNSITYSNNAERNARHLCYHWPPLSGEWAANLARSRVKICDRRVSGGKYSSLVKVDCSPKHWSLRLEDDACPSRWADVSHSSWQLRNANGRSVRAQLWFSHWWSPNCASLFVFVVGRIRSRFLRNAHAAPTLVLGQSQNHLYGRYAPCVLTCWLRFVQLVALSRFSTNKTFDVSGTLI